MFNVFECLRLFSSVLPSTPLLIDEEEVEIFLMSSVILNFLFSIFMRRQSVCVFGEENHSEEEEGQVLSFKADCPFKNASDWINRG